MSIFSCNGSEDDLVTLYIFNPSVLEDTIFRWPCFTTFAEK